MSGELCPCGKPAAHLEADPDSAAWACRVPPYPSTTSAAEATRLDALRAASGLPRRGGHAGPARRTTSLRLTEAQYAAIDAAVAAGYGSGLNAVIARLIDERLATDARVEPARTTPR